MTLSGSIPRMSTFTLAICLTTSNLPWFMDLTFQLPMQYCSFQHLKTAFSMGFSSQENWSGFPSSSPVDPILSELSTMTCPTWVALHNMAHTFIELDRAVVHVIRLVSFLCLWFTFCLPSDGEGWEAYGSFLMGGADWEGNWVLFWWAGPGSVNL